MKCRCAYVWLEVPLFFVVSRGLSMLWKQWLPGTPAGYLAAWTTLRVLCAHSAWKGQPSRLTLAAAATCFAISSSLLQLSMPVCSDWRWGTHFVWHLLNAATLGLTTWSMKQLHLMPAVKN